MTVKRSRWFVDAYDLVIFDLDGVVYLVDRPIPSAVAAICRLRADGTRLAYATNNASRSSAEVADLLTRIGVPAGPEQVLTSGAAAASVLAERLPAGAPVLVVGSPALGAEVRAAGLLPVSRAEEAPVAVVQGYGPRVGWAELAEASLAVRAGALWVATNLDPTLPSARGALPGNGALIAAVRTTLDRAPDLVVGKPEPGLFTSAAQRAGALRPLVVGDRLDTDVEGAVRAGMDSLLVFTGVTGVAELLQAPPSRRPDFVAADLGGLFEAADALALPARRDVVPDSGGWRLTGDGRGLRLDGAGAALAAVPLLCAAAWSGRRVGTLRAGSPAAEQALRSLGLAGHVAQSARG